MVNYAYIKEDYEIIPEENSGESIYLNIILYSFSFNIFQSYNPCNIYAICF